MVFNFFRKKVRGRFGFPSGTVATNPDTARFMIEHILQLGFYVGKSTTIEPRAGNPEDVFLDEWNAIGYTNPGLKETVEGFKELKETTPDDVALMPQIGESDEESFAHCAAEFDKIGVDALEINVSCPHASKGGILIGSNPKSVHSIVAATRKATKLPLWLKLNAGVPNLEQIAVAGINAGANGLSLINTLRGDNAELYNEFGGLSGPRIYPVLLETTKRLRKVTDAPFILMGGISTAKDIRQLEKIAPDSLYAIGTAFSEMSSGEIMSHFRELEEDLQNNTNKAKIKPKRALQYKPFVVKEAEQVTEDLKLLRFHQNVNAGAGQYIFLKVDNKHAKPFSVANDENGLEILVRKVGDTTSKIFDLKKNSVVRIKGPFGKAHEFDWKAPVMYVGAGCGIGPIHHAAKHHLGEKIFVLGAKTAAELTYLESFGKMGDVYLSTDDGSIGYHGNVAELLSKVLEEKNSNQLHFFNCGPEIAMKFIDEVERAYENPSYPKRFHLVERYTSCNTGICGKCSTPKGLRSCVDGPVFSSFRFTPGQYTRDKTGKKVTI